MVFVWGDLISLISFACRSLFGTQKNRIVGFIRIVLSSDVLIFFILYDLMIRLE